MAQRKLTTALAAVLLSGGLAACASQTQPATGVGGLTATLQATGHSDSTPAHFRFQYARSEADLGTAQGKQTPLVGPVPPHVPSGGGDVAFSQGVGGLALGTTYVFRVCGGDGSVTPDRCAQTRSLTTAAQPVQRTFAAQAGGFPVDITRGPDAALWFTEQQPGAVGRIDPAGAIRERLLPAGWGAPESITTGPDGALWFTLSDDYVGRLAPSGALNRFPAPGSDPRRIVAGPDGAVWFTELHHARIGRMSTGGSFSERVVPGESDDIAAGPDGALWTTETSGDAVVRLTAAGGVTVYGLPGAGPSGITAGPDGALWFTEAGPRAIGRITTGGTISAFPIPPPNGIPDRITSADDALWFSTDFVRPDSDQVLGRVGLSGQISTFPNAVGSDGIATGPDGAIWTTGLGAQIVRNG